MRNWDRIKRNSLFILFILNCTIFYDLSKFQQISPNITTDFQISDNSKNNLHIQSPFSNYILTDESVQSQIQEIEDINGSFSEIYNQINPSLVKDKFTGRNMKIAVLDSGINNNSWIKIKEPRYTTITNSSKVEDESGHGTIVASIINKIAPDAHLISIKVTNKEGFAKTEWVEKGLELALSLNVSIIHASLGSTELNSMNSTLISEITKNNIPFIVSAGNYGPFGTSITTPAIYPDIIAVGMAYNQTHLPLTSSSGPRLSGSMGPDIVAPGVNIISYNHENNVVNVSGTSFAAPFVTGGIALLKENFSNIPIMTLKAALLSSAKFMNNTSPIHQGNGFINLSDAYMKLLETNEENPMFILAPREISSYFSYFGHTINGINRTYKITLYSTVNCTFLGFNITQTYPIYHNLSINDTITHEFPLKVKINNIYQNLTQGSNTLDFSLYIPLTLSMEKRKGNVSLYFSYGTNNTVTVSNLILTIENRYPGGNILFYQGYDNDSFISDGPTGRYSQLQKLLEFNLGFQLEGAIRPSSLISPIDPLFITEKISGGISNSDLEQQHILILSDIELEISDEEIALIREWVSEGHSLLVLSFPSQRINGTETLSNQIAINKLLETYGIAIEDDFTNLTRFHHAVTEISDPIFNEELKTFDYKGTSITVSFEKGGKVLASAIEDESKEKKAIAAYWEDMESKGKVVVFGGLLPFIDTGVLSNPNEVDNLFVILSIFRWMIIDQQIPTQILLTSDPTKGESTKIQISFDDLMYNMNYVNGTIIESNGSFSQISFSKKNNIYIATWEPVSPGNAVLWFNLHIPDKVPTNGIIYFRVSDTYTPDLFLLIIIGGLILFGVTYFLLYSRQSQIRSPIEERLAFEFKKQKQQRKAKHYGLETREICPQCQSPRYKPESKYCYKCGKEL